MKKFFVIFIALSFLLTGIACAPLPQQPDQYNTQRGAAIGAGIGALTGQAIGGNTESTLLGTGIGMLVGTIIGNAIDQSNQAAREAAATNKRVVYYDNQGSAVEAIPGPVNQQTRCRKVTKRVWENGSLASETIEEICEGEKFTTDY